MNPNLKKELIKQSNSIKPKFFIGKNGIDTNLIEGLNSYLTKHSIVKIKMQTVSDKEEILPLVQRIVSKIENSSLIQIKGFTATIYKED